ncbi:MAG: hypothetical protein KGL95_05345 [Patescibacteria group bacterium]|nr:hypothetical protein [Patescibacteria group bacterium]
MELKKITPKFIRRILVLREYRITKAIIRNLKKNQIPDMEQLLRDYNEVPQLRSKDFYESLARLYKDQLIQNEGRLEELQHEMRELGIPLE